MLQSKSLRFIGLWLCSIWVSLAAVDIADNPCASFAAGHPFGQYRILMDKKGYRRPDRQGIVSCNLFLSFQLAPALGAYMLLC
jgi:hypothetical protein